MGETNNVRFYFKPDVVFYLFAAPLLPLILELLTLFVGHFHKPIFKRSVLAEMLVNSIPMFPKTKTKSAEQDAAKYNQSHGLPIRQGRQGAYGGDNPIPKQCHHATHGKKAKDHQWYHDAIFRSTKMLFHMLRCLILRTNKSVCFVNVSLHSPFGW